LVGFVGFSSTVHSRKKKNNVWTRHCLAAGGSQEMRKVATHMCTINDGWSYQHYTMTSIFVLLQNCSKVANLNIHWQVFKHDVVKGSNPDIKGFCKYCS
ncbi:MAG: hypothetical protein ACK55I_28170, partial [bacterium]